MTQDSRRYIKEIAEELALAMHQSRDKEVSGLFVEIRKDISGLRAEVKQMSDQVQPIITEAEFWNQFWGRIKQGGNMLTWAVGVIAAALILTGQAKVLFLTWLSSRTF